LLEDCCPESCSWDRQLQAGGGSFRNFGGFAEILSLLWPGRRGAGARAAPDGSGGGDEVG
jgi:hypothetical protein